MTSSETQDASTKHYFVDESGDGVVFDSKGRVLIGTRGCQEFFILGLVDVENPDLLSSQMDALRFQILEDPYFRNVPSIQPCNRKTALSFHAKDDLPEVRKDVFKLLLNSGLKFFAVVKEMQNVLEYVRNRNRMDSGYRYKPNELYDLSVRMLFKQRLHTHDHYRICFSRRGNNDRTEALRESLILARNRFCQEHRIEKDCRIEVVPLHNRQNAGLQAADYFLWAVQRLYEKGEERYIQYLWPKVSLIHDVDADLNSEYGIYYSKKKPLSAASIKTSRGYRIEWQAKPSHGM